MKGARSLLVTSVAILALVFAKETFGVPLRTVDTVSDGAIGTGGPRESTPVEESAPVRRMRQLLRPLQMISGRRASSA